MHLSEQRDGQHSRRDYKSGRGGGRGSSSSDRRRPNAQGKNKATTSQPTRRTGSILFPAKTNLQNLKAKKVKMTGVKLVYSKADKNQCITGTITGTGYHNWYNFKTNLVEQSVNRLELVSGDDTMSVQLAFHAGATIGFHMSYGAAAVRPQTGAKVNDEARTLIPGDHVSLERVSQESTKFRLVGLLRDERVPDPSFRVMDAFAERGELQVTSTNYSNDRFEAVHLQTGQKWHFSNKTGFVMSPGTRWKKSHSDGSDTIEVVLRDLQTISDAQSVASSMDTEERTEIAGGSKGNKRSGDTTFDIDTQLNAMDLVKHKKPKDS